MSYNNFIKMESDDLRQEKTLYFYDSNFEDLNYITVLAINKNGEYDFEYSNLEMHKNGLNEKYPGMTIEDKIHLELHDNDLYECEGGSVRGTYEDILSDLKHLLLEEDLEIVKHTFK